MFDCVLNFLFDDLFYFDLPLCELRVKVGGVLDFAEAAVEHVFDEAVAVVLLVVLVEVGGDVFGFVEEGVGGGGGVAVHGVFVVAGGELWFFAGVGVVEFGEGVFEGVGEFGVRGVLLFFGGVAAGHLTD